ncbi:hypothetical protein HQQ81_00155 [Microbacteriaceae bacterium VKM Ac-2854]|nr:hypothetical protein [Microbacteriaceae bacterium VKM Ac-2854]
MRIRPLSRATAAIAPLLILAGLAAPMAAATESTPVPTAAPVDCAASTSPLDSGTATVTGGEQAYTVTLSDVTFDPCWSDTQIEVGYYYPDGATEWGSTWTYTDFVKPAEIVDGGWSSTSSYSTYITTDLPLRVFVDAYGRNPSVNVDRVLLADTTVTIGPDPWSSCQAGANWLEVGQDYVPPVRSMASGGAGSATFTTEPFDLPACLDHVDFLVKEVVDGRLVDVSAAVTVDPSNPAPITVALPVGTHELQLRARTYVAGSSAHRGGVIAAGTVEVTEALATPEPTATATPTTPAATPTSVPSVVTAGARLASTGVEVGPLATAAVLLVLLGAGLGFARRRRVN